MNKSCGVYKWCKNAGAFHCCKLDIPLCDMYDGHVTRGINTSIDRGINERKFKAWLINRIDFLNFLVKLNEGADIAFINGQLAALNGIKGGMDNGSFED